MSTSDAAAPERRVVTVGGETATPLCGTAAPQTPATTARDEKRHCADETPAERCGLGSAIRQEGTRKALILRADTLRKTSHCGDSDVQPRFTSHAFLRLSNNSDHDRLNRNSVPGLHSVIEPQQVETKHSSLQINGRPSSPHRLTETSRICQSSETIPSTARKDEEVSPAVCNGQETNRDFGPHEHNGLHIHPSQPSACCSSVTGVSLEEDIKQHREPGKQTDLCGTMLSSTVVTVLAPHWSGRLRRSKRFDGSGNSEGNSQDVSNTAANCEHSFQETQSAVESVLTDRPRVPFLGTRRSTVGWSAKSDPSSLDYQSRREITQTVSLDVNAGRMHSRDTDAGALRSPLSTAASSRPPFFHEQRRSPQTDLQRGFSSLSAKQTTSSLLLSLRSFSSSDRNSNSEGNTSSLSNDGNEKLFATHLSQAFLNNNEHEKTKSLLSPSYRTPDTGPDLSPSTSTHRERNTSDSVFFSTSPVSRDAEGLHFQHLPTISRTQSSQGPSEWQQSSRTSETPVSSPRCSPYDHSALQKTHSFPRRTTLTSTSWWKQVTQDSSSPHPLNNSPSIRDKSNTPFIPPCGDNGDTTVPSLTDSKRLGSQILNNRDNNNTAESAFKGNMNISMQTHNIKQINADNSPDPRSDRLIKQQCGSNLNNREPQKPHRALDVLTTSKISRATPQTTLSHPKDPCKNDVSSGPFTPNVTDLPPTLLNPNSSNTPTESSSKYKVNHCPPKTNNAPVSPHNVDSQRFTKQSLSLDLSTGLNSRALTSHSSSGVPLNTRSLSFHSHPQTSINTGSSSLTPKFTNKTSATPLGFERSYAPIPKPFQPKPVSALIPTVSSLSKTNYIPASTSSSISSPNASSHLVATTDSSQTLLSLPAKSSPTSLTVSSLLTPPATPVITSPSYSETSSPKAGRTFSSSPERDPKKPEGKKARRVTWEDSVDVQRSEPATVEKPNQSRVQTNPISPPRFPRTTPSIFSFLRSSSPSTSASLCSPAPKASSMLVGKGGKYRSLSSDSAERERNKQRPGDQVNFVQGRQDFTTPRQERTLSVESGTAQCRPSAALSLPPDFSSDYNLRYSSPPYSAMKSSRLAQTETKTMTPRFFSHSSQSNYTPQRSLHPDLGPVMTSSTSRPPLSPIRPLQPLSLSVQKNTPAQEISKCELSESDQANNNHNKNKSQDHQNNQILLVDNRVQISSQTSQVDKTHHSSSTYVTETLVYSIKSKVETTTPAPKSATPKPSQHTANTAVSVETSLSQQSHHAAQRKEAGDNPCTRSDQSSSGSSSTDSQSRDDEGCSKMRKENTLGKSRFFSVEVNNEQSPKRSRFALKKSVSTPSSSLSRSESEKANKSNNKMDQVLNRLRQKFSTRRSEEDLSFPWKWKRASQAPSVSGSSDTSNVSDISVEKKERVLSDTKRDEEGTSRWTHNRYTIITPSAESTACSEPAETEQVDQNVCAEHTSENKLHLTVHSPASHKFDFYKDGPDYKATNQFLSCRDPSPGRSPNPSATCSSQFRKSTPSPRSPFSPFSSLSPLSPFSSPDVTDDSVFYSPKLQRRRESSSPCELSEGISLGGRRRSRASTGPPSANPGQDKDHLTSSYADLKYGIEPGRSFSVSSVLSSRPSGPGRISTGSRFMSVGDLTQAALSCGGNSRDLDQWCTTSDGSTGFGFQRNDHRMSYFPSDPGKMRSRSLPRSLTRCLTNWSSDVPTSQPVNATASKPARLWSPNMNVCHFAWDTDGPPTPPPTPPLSPVSRRMSKPPSQSSPTFPSPPGTSQQGDSQSSRGLLPSRGYVSSLSTFEESSDSSSDTTTDDEYYLETDDDGEKETEL